MVADDGVNGAVLNPFHHGAAVFLAAQGRGEPGKGAVIAHGDLVESEIGRRRIAGDVEPARLGPAHHIHRISRGEKRGVIAASRQFQQPDVALEADGLGGIGNAGQPQTGGDFSIVHDTVTGKTVVLRALNDEKAEAAGVAERPAHDQAVIDGGYTVAEGHGAGFGHQAHLGDFLAFKSLGQRCHGVNVDKSRLAGAAADEFHQGDTVDDGVGVGQNNDGGDPARRCRDRRFPVLVTGITEPHPHVHKAGSQDTPPAVYGLRVLRRAVGKQAGSKIGDQSVLAQEAARGVETACGINQAGVHISSSGSRSRGGRGSGCRGCLFLPRPGFFSALRHQVLPPLCGRAPVSVSRQAMRTATPISTCSRMTLRSMSSASSPSISTPRFMGPGCMIRASGLATSSLA